MRRSGYLAIGVALGAAAAALVSAAPAAMTAGGERGVALYKLVFETALDRDDYVDEPDQVKINEFTILRDNVALSVADILMEPINENDTRATSNAKKLFVSCLDEDTIERKGFDKLIDVINKELGGWPILNGISNYSNGYSLVNKLVSLRKYHTSQLFEVFISLNPKNPKRNILRVNKIE